MLWTIIGILVLLWVLGMVFEFVAGGLIHVLLVIAVIIFIFNLITGRNKRQRRKIALKDWRQLLTSLFSSFEGDCFTVQTVFSTILLCYIYTAIELELNNIERLFHNEKFI